MEGSKKFEDAALRGTTSHHVWKSRTSDLTVINLRDLSEVLGTQEAAAVTPAAAEVKRPAAPPSPAPAPRPTTGKQESLNALLSKLQLGRPAAEAATTTTTPKTVRVAGWTAAAAAPTLAPAPPAAATAASQRSPVPPPAPTLPAPVAAAAPLPLPPPPPVRVAEAHRPTFPDLREASSSAAGQFEFLSGINIPGQGGAKKTEAPPPPESSSMALFHDPLWGGGSLLGAFATPSPARRSPKTQPRTSLSDVFAAATAMTAPPTRAFTATPPAATHTPVASPPVPTLTTVTPLPTTMTPPHMSMMGGVVSAPPPTMAAPYPMYPMPLQYVAQPQFPGGVMYNSAAFFPYGATAMMMPQPQHLPQGYQMASAAMMRPGTNVKAMPFVPGSTM